MPDELPVRRPRLTGPAEGELVGGYRLESRIGAGGMAVVYRARDERLDRAVALKVLTSALTLDEEFRKRFIRESRAASVVDHPNIIPIYSAGEDSGVLYLAMRHVSGGDLHSIVEREGPLPAARAAALLSPVASALDAAHRAGIIHRDVKPANVLVDTSPGRPDHPYLSDFGLAKREAGSRLTVAGEFVGTAGFAAPEQINGQQPRAASDQYALACVAFTLLTATLPFRGGSLESVLWEQMSQPPPKVTPHRPDLPAAVDDVLARGLARNPDTRYPGCAAFADALGQALSGRTLPAPPGAAPPSEVPAPAPPSQVSVPPVTQDAPRGHRRRPRGRGRNLALAATAVAVAAAVTATVLTAVHQDTSGRRTASQPGDRTITPKLAATLSGSGAAAETMAFRPDGTLEIIGQNNVASDYDIASQRARTSYNVGSSFVSTDDAVLSLDGTVFADPPGGCESAGTGPCTDSIYSVAQERVLTSIQVGDGGAGAAAGDFALAAPDDSGSGVQVWNMRTLDSIATLTGPGARAPQSVAVSPDGGTVAVATPSAGGTHRIHVWNVSSQAQTASVTVPRKMGTRWMSLFQAGAPVTLGGSALAASDGLTTNIYRLNPSARLVATVPGGQLALSPDGTLLATTDPARPDAVDLWNTRTGTKAGTLTIPAPDPQPARAVFSSDSASFALSCNNGHTYVWRVS